MISLSCLDNKEKIKKIAEKDPKLLYFICHKMRPDYYPIQWPLIDRQEDCKTLSKFNLFDYTPPRERDTHISDPFCKFRKSGEKVAKELLEKNICKEMLEFVTQHINREEFAKRFREKFTFDPIEKTPLKEKYCDIKEEYRLSFPEKGYNIDRNGCSYSFSYEIENDIFYFIIEIECKCTNLLEKRISENDFNGYSRKMYKCENCKSEFIISNDFRQFLPILSKLYSD
ncbi:MAG: hypothetical protein ACOC44_09215 [Promethearchaeia archaeon]